MGLGVGIFLIAVGAILAFAVNATSGAVDVHTVGWILMGVGFASVLLALLFWQTWVGPGYWTRRRTYVREAPPPIEYLTALSTRFVSTCRALSGSAAISGASAGASSCSSMLGGA